MIHPADDVDADDNDNNIISNVCMIIKIIIFFFCIFVCSLLRGYILMLHGLRL